MTASPYQHGQERNAANYTPLTPVSFLAKAAHVYPERPAVIHGAVRRNWREVYERSRRLASALAASGVKRGETVAAMLPNVPAMIELHFGPAMIGAEVVERFSERQGLEAEGFPLCCARCSSFRVNSMLCSTSFARSSVDADDRLPTPVFDKSGSGLKR